VIPIWFDLDDDTFVFTAGETTVKVRNMRRDPRVSLCIDDEEPPFHFVLVDGTAEMTADDPDLLYWATRLGGRYMGAELAESYGRRNAVPSELLVRVTPEKIVARKNIADLSNRTLGSDSRVAGGSPRGLRSVDDPTLNWRWSA